MKLAIVVRRLSTHGGTERFALGLSRYLVALGHHVDAWCAGADEIPEGVTLRPLPVRGRGRLLKMLALDRAAARVPRDDYDLVLGFSRARGADLYRAGGGCHQAWMAERRWSVADEVERELDRRVVLGARRVVVNSRMAAEDLSRHYGLPLDRTRLVRNGVDLQRFRPDPGAGLPVPEPAVAFLGSGWARKGLDAALHAVARVDGVHLAVLGTDPHAARYQRLAARLGLGARAHFLGQVDRPEALLPGARALLLPTRYDPSANAVLEAMACGVPVVTTRRNGAAEVLPEPWMAATDAADVDGLAGALERVLHSPGLGDACRAAAEQWPAERAFAHLAELARELVADSSSREHRPA